MLKAFGDPPLFAEGYGQWPPRVVAMHGWARDRKDFAAAFEGLDALSLDLPGFGQSPEPPDAWSSAQYGERIAEFLRSDVGQPVVLVGHSFGGRVAVRVAANHPDLVSSVVLTGAPIARPPRPAVKPKPGYRLVRWLNKVGVVSDDRLEAARQKYGSTDYARAQGVMRQVLVGVLSEDYEPDVRRVTCPVRLVWGGEDRDVPMDVAELAASQFSDARLRVVDGVGHLLPTQRPEALREEIDKLLEGDVL